MFLVRRPGLQTTIQDLGRPGYGRYGVPMSGAMDTHSFRLGNLLLDNSSDAAGLEATLVGPELEVLAAGVCAYTGADMNLTVRGQKVRPGCTFAVEEGDMLRFGAGAQGARSYLCVSGGLDVPPVLGSRSTAVTARLGGLDGRSLLGGDVLSAFGSPYPRTELVGRRLRVGLTHEYKSEPILRLVEGPQGPEMQGALEMLLSASWRVSSQLNRLGIRLEGPALPTTLETFRTEGVPVGAVQVPADGAPILLLADRQTTGGYPKPAVIAAVDLPLAGQLRPGDTLRFQLVSRADSVRLLHEQEASLARGILSERASTDVVALAQLIQTLQSSRVQEIRVETAGGTFHWKRDGQDA